MCSIEDVCKLTERLRLLDDLRVSVNAAMTNLESALDSRKRLSDLDLEIGELKRTVNLLKAEREAAETADQLGASAFHSPSFPFPLTRFRPGEGARTGSYSEEMQR